MIVQSNAWEPWSNIMADINFCNSMYLRQFISTENMTISFLRKTRLCLPAETSDWINRLFGVSSILQVPQVPQEWILGGSGLTIDLLPKEVHSLLQVCNVPVCFHSCQRWLHSITSHPFWYPEPWKFSDRESKNEWVFLHHPLWNPQK